MADTQDLRVALSKGNFSSFLARKIRWNFLLLFLVSFFALLWFDLAILAQHGWQPKALILERSEEIPLKQGWGIGYDAQWYYAIALDPGNAWERLDQPAYRYQRIVFPLLVRGLSLGNPGFIPWAMLAVNLLAAALSCVLFGSLLARRGATPWLAVVFIFSLGYLLSLRLDLLEPLALFFALAGLFAFEEDDLPLAVILFALGGLTKEVALMFPLGLAVWEGFRKNWRSAAILLFGCLGLYLAWYIILRLWLGTSAGQAAQSTPTWIPFYGVRFLGDPVSRVLVGLWVLSPAVIGGVVALIDLFPWMIAPLVCWNQVKNKGHKGCTKEIFLVLAQVGLIALMPAPTWADPLAILRVGLGLLAVLLVWLASAHPRLLPFAAALWLPSGLVLFFVPGLF